jgi:hypothetical protein
MNQRGENKMTRGTKGSSRAKAKGQAKSSQFASKVLGWVRLMEKSSMDYWQKVKRLEQIGSTFRAMQNLLNGKRPDETDLREIWGELACHAKSTRDIHDKWIEDMEQKEKGKIESHQYTESEKEKRLEKLADWKNKEMRLQNLTEKPQFWAGFDLNANQMLGFVNEIQDQLAAARARLDEKKAREDREHINSLHEGAISDIESAKSNIESERDAAQRDAATLRAWVGQMAENTKVTRATVEAMKPTIEQTAAVAAATVANTAAIRETEAAQDKSLKILAARNLEELEAKSEGGKKGRNLQLKYGKNVRDSKDKASLGWLKEMDDKIEKGHHSISRAAELVAEGKKIKASTLETYWHRWKKTGTWKKK